jgi:ribonuclease T1
MIQRLVLFGVIMAAVVFGYPYLADRLGQPNGAPQTTAAPDQETRFILRDMRIEDRDGRLAYRGDVDLRPELARIERGERDPHDNDGSVFQNREGRLPKQQRGYYREYVVRTPGIGHAGPQRLVIGAAGEIYYTSDHYRSFKRIE